MKCNASSQFGRRAFLQLSGLVAAGSCLPPLSSAAGPGGPLRRATHTLRIGKGEVELAHSHRFITTTYNGHFPGPLLRTTVGQQVRIDVYNDTDVTEQIHWQGQDLADARIPAHSTRRMEFTPQRPGLYLYHSEVVAATDLGAGLYSGQAGALLVAPLSDPGRHDREWSIILKGCQPFMRRTARGCEVGYAALTLNGRLPGQGQPLRAKRGERALVHVLNAGATESYELKLPGHVFEVIALDGCPLALPVTSTALQLGPGQRVSAYVVMGRDAGWQLRETTELTRYAGNPAPAMPVEAVLPMVLTRHPAARSGLNRWSIDGGTYRVRSRGHYRLQIHNSSDEAIPLHLQRHRLQVGGVLRDVVVVGAQERVAVDFRADNRGPALFHCTRQLHADFGLRALIDYT